ncbi:MAG: hypothetical protein ACF8NJ_03605 [Phycisphaerales bacterium JB038]
MPIRRAFLWSMIVSLSLAAFFGVVTIAFGDDWRIMGQITGTTLTWGGFSIVCLMQAFAIERRKLVPLMWIGLVGCALSFLLWALLIWVGDSMNWEVASQLSSVGASITMATIALGFIGLISVPNLHVRWMQIIRRITILCITIFASLFILMIWYEDYADWDFVERLWRAMGAFAILSAAGIIAVPVLWKLQALREQTRTTLPQQLLVRLTCPRCATAQEINAGAGACANCGLRINIDIEEPRCPCGYLLFQLQGDRCPECGRAIAAKDRWATEEAAPAPETPAPSAAPKSVEEADGA